MKEVKKNNRSKCHAKGCNKNGEFRAPKSRSEINQYHLFCLQHVKEYNKKWNFFEGMSNEEFENFLKNDITGHKKTYKFGSGGDININEKDLFESLFGFYNGKKSHYIQDKESKKNTQLTKKQKEALHRFNLNDKATLENVKSKYKKLAKIFHPDLNKGNKRMEEEFKKLTSAYKELQSLKQ